MGEKCSCGHQTSGEISSGKLCRGGPCNPIGVDIFANSDKIYETSVCGSEKVLLETFLSHLFLGKSKTLPPVVGALSMFRVKKYGLCLHNPVTSAASKYTS